MPADGKNQKQAIVADLLIRDVEIFDGSGDATWRGSCAIADGHIISLSTAESRADTQPIRAKQEIDGSGFALAPGFIDIHTHDDKPAAIDFLFCSNGLSISWTFSSAE